MDQGTHDSVGISHIINPASRSCRLSGAKVLLTGWVVGWLSSSGLAATIHKASVATGDREVQRGGWRTDVGGRSI